MSYTITNITLDINHIYILYLCSQYSKKNKISSKMKKTRFITFDQTVTVYCCIWTMTSSHLFLLLIIPR